MIRNGYFTAGDPLEDGDVSTPRVPGYWLNRDPQQVLVGQISKRDCTNANGALVVDWPRAEVRTVATPCPSPSPTPSPGPTPTPPPNGCPALFQTGGSFLSAVDCGKKCRDQGYLGVRVNYTATDLCKEGDPGCVCDPARNRCEMPKTCQNPNGADIFITLAGHFENDECDRNSDNFFNCHHKPKANETGVTLFTSTPWQNPKDPWDPRAVTNCVDVQEHGTRQLPRADARCQAALKAAGR
jgi:hypothetical protein